MPGRSGRRSKEVDYAKFYKPSERRKPAENTKRNALSCSQSTSSTTSTIVSEVAEPTVRRRSTRGVEAGANHGYRRDSTNFYKPCEPTIRRKSAPGSSNSTSASKDEGIAGMAFQRRRELSESKAANAEELVEELEALLRRARNIPSIDDQILDQTIDLNVSYNKALRAAESRVKLIKAIPSFCDRYPMICFEGISEAQLCDFVWAYFSLDEHHLAVHGTDKEEEPTFYKLLYWLDKAIRDGENEEMAKRWSQELIDTFWRQMY